MKDISNRKDIEFLIDEFYKQILKDDLIGVFFTDIVQLNWKEHIPIMYDFWETTLFGVAKYKGNPMLKHIYLHDKKELKSIHFERWLSLWENTIHKNFDGEIANAAIKKANMIGDLMQLKIGKNYLK